MQTTSVTNSDIPSLTGIRAVAALSIAFAHIGTNVDVWLFGMWDLAILGMPIFFTLSGFVIHYVYAAPLAQSGTAYSFFAARIARLYPLFLAFFVYFAFYTPFGQIVLDSNNWWATLSYLTLTFSWIPFTVNEQTPIQHRFGVSWSVSTEAFFYVAYACGLWRISRIKGVNTCLALLVSFCLGSLLLMALLFWSWPVWEDFIVQFIPMPTRNTDWLNSFSRWFLYVSPYTRILEFIGGCLTCQLFLLVKAAPETHRKVPVATLATLGAAAVVGTFVLFLVVRPYSHGLWPTDGWSWSRFIVALHLNFLFAPGCYLLYFALALGASAVGRVLSSRIMVWLGIISYSIYLGHPVALSYFWVGADHPHKGWGFLESMAATIVLATCTYFLIESPGRYWVRLGLERLRRTYRS